MTAATPPPPPAAETPVTEAELHAYADRQLTAERTAEVAAWLARRPDETARVRAWEEQKHGLHALFDPVLDEVVPAALLQRSRRRAPWFGRPALAAAAAALLVVAAAAGGWTLRGAHDAPLVASAGRANDFAARAAIAHAVYAPEVRRPVEVDAAHEDQLVTWLSKRMGAPMKAPHLQALGYELEGGRLLPGDRGPVAQFMYRDAGGQRLTLYVSNEIGDLSPAASGARRGGEINAETAFRFAREGRLNVFYWVEGRFGYAISADADKAALTDVAGEVYRQLASTAAEPPR